MNEDFFPPRPAAAPTIYAFASTHPDHAGLLKVGYTERIAADRIAEQFPSGLNAYRIELIEPAMRADGSSFTDHDIHRHLRARGIKNTSHEWFKCTVSQVRAAVVAVRERTANVEDRTLSFGLRPEQTEAVDMTADYFSKAKTEQPGHTPHFLWNAKMRFGKTFASYQLAKKMGWTKVLVLTFKPAVVHAWSEDLNRHIDFEGWQFINRDGELTYEQADKNKPIVCFGSFQDFLQRTSSGAIAAGSRAGIGAAALPPVLDAMEEPLASKSITLSCGKLTTGITVRPWAGMLMLRKCSSPETYFQSAFRVQSPWTVNDEAGNEIVVKPECYVFDFAPNRALRQIADYGSRLATDETTPEQRVAELVGFLPVLAYDGSSMRQLDAEAILDIATAGTSATLLAKRWESVLLVNVDDSTLGRLMRDEATMAAIANIEGFRNLNAGEMFETIINRSEQIKDAKRKAGEGEEPSAKEKKELTEAEKERKSLRKQVQEKLIKFAARAPVFMYLTDFREQRLKDVITKLEPRLFQKVTGLTTADFERLVSLGVFNSALMNDAVWKFRRYEDASLRYMGVERHRPLELGLWDTALTEEDFQQTFEGLVKE